MKGSRVEKQIEFAREIDRLKRVERRTLLADGSRLENSAEHSWHIALLAVLLVEHAKDREIDLLRVVRMLLVHDLVEIDAGDTYCYDEEGRRGQADRERRAAERIFGLLPEDQAAALRAAWEEFDRGETPEARFAAALDRVQPVLLNHSSGGKSWVEHGIRRDQVLERIRPAKEGAPALWKVAAELLDDAVERGWLQE
jgi:putative hydrolase of HD superfamily